MFPFHIDPQRIAQAMYLHANPAAAHSMRLDHFRREHDATTKAVQRWIALGKPAHLVPEIKAKQKALAGPLQAVIASAARPPRARVGVDLVCVGDPLHGMDDPEERQAVLDDLFARVEIILSA